MRQITEHDDEVHITPLWSLHWPREFAERTKGYSNIWKIRCFQSDSSKQTYRLTDEIDCYVIRTALQ